MAEPLFTLPPYDEAIAYLREHFDEIEQGKPWYEAPCAIGVLMPEDVRGRFESSIVCLVSNDYVGIANRDDLDRYGRLQDTNDNGTVSALRALIFGEAPQ
jgi:hypothetical protein